MGARDLFPPPSQRVTSRVTSSLGYWAAWRAQIVRAGVYTLSVGCAVLLFVGGPDYDSPRLYRSVWEFGHIFAFFVWTVAVLVTYEPFARLSLQRQLVLTLPVVISVGALIELAQVVLGRSYSALDIVNDLLGSTAAIAFVSYRGSSASTRSLAIIRGVIVAFLVIQSWPVAKTLIDDTIAWWQFPLLADFETPFELTRWRGTDRITIDKRMSRHGTASLSVLLQVAKYSGASLQHFPADWRGYMALRLSIHNPLPGIFPITISVHDARHVETGRAYSDRFTTTIRLYSGWNEIEIPLDQIETAPRSRRLDLRAVRDVSILAVDVHEPRVIYIDNVGLVD